MEHPLVVEYLQWADKTFDKANINSILHHLRDELDEYFSPNADEHEIADCAQLMFHGVDKIIKDPYIMEMVKEKLEINKKRVWLPPDERGVSYHAKDS
jgi:hypothetical protein